LPVARCDENVYNAGIPATVGPSTASEDLWGIG